MPQRLLADDATRLPLEHEPLPADEVLDGAPTTAVRTLGTVGDVEVGVWEMSAGTARDTEVDEVFVVLSGSGTVEFEDGERILLAPGTVVRLSVGERTRWTVEEPLRKVWIA
ncbi:cupin domain-containing protein [Arthrobacter sp. NEB 688]|uniref:cupin domain-containing protein n=1 Tax=Arthrobacter sp. NEB 688 TaxID=904039 RepID=UPI001567BBD1|nr:cupin domain-containing protein [Arthrobacter sp. NEB 688]QKE85058.1 cupin domain-containing protein [Arthrobacter sp. NEB 688]